MKSNKPCGICSKAITDDLHESEFSRIYCSDCGQVYHIKCWKSIGSRCKVVNCPGRNPKLSGFRKVLCTIFASKTNKLINVCPYCNTEISFFDQYCFHCGEIINSKNKLCKSALFKLYSSIRLYFYPILSTFIILISLCICKGLFSEGKLKRQSTKISETITFTTTPSMTNTLSEKINITPVRTTTITSTTITPTPIKTFPVLEPENFIILYYEKINEGDFILTWSLLSDNFKENHHCCTETGDYDYQPYYDWWNSIERMEIHSAKIISEDLSTAIVSITLTYHKKNNSSSYKFTHQFTLIKAENEYGWQIYQ